MAVIKLLFVVLTEYYHHSQPDTTSASCSPQEIFIIPYVIGHEVYDVTFTSLSMLIEVFIPLAAITIFHWRVSTTEALIPTLRLYMYMTLYRWTSCTDL